MKFSFDSLKTIYYNNRILIGSIRFINDTITIVTVPYKNQ